MKVFELARETNLPSKALMDRMLEWGFPVQGVFSVMDDKTVSEVRARLAESKPAQKPATRAATTRSGAAPRSRIRARSASPELAAPAPAPAPSPPDASTPAPDPGSVAEIPAETSAEQSSTSTEEQAAPQAKRRRRLISVRSSGEVLHLEQISAAAAAAKLEAESLASDASDAHDALAETESEAAPAETPEGELSVTSSAAEELMGSSAESPFAATKSGPSGHERPTARAGEGKESSETKDPKRAPPRAAERQRPQEAVVEPWRVLRGDARAIQPLTSDEWVRPHRSKRTSRRPMPLRRQPMRRSSGPRHTFNPRQRSVRIGARITVAELAGLIGVKGAELLRKLQNLGVQATMSEFVDGTTAELLASEYNIQVKLQARDMEGEAKAVEIAPEELVPRAPVITVMGHVDHGKTTLLDRLRSSHVAEGEAGGITQHIGAYEVSAAHGKMVFLDTPGHEVFSALRKRGANVTDLVVLVVAAEDGVMPQTVEAIAHARAANAPVLVAINKIDHPNADLEKVKRQLVEQQLIAEDFGGEVVMVPISAKTGAGIDHLLEMIHLQAELLELRSSAQGSGRGIVIESSVSPQRGILATVLIQQGTLRMGDHFLAGSASGRVRAMQNHEGQTLHEAGPSTPVELLGWSTLPQSGDALAVLDQGRDVKQLAQQRANGQQLADLDLQRRNQMEQFLEESGAESESHEFRVVIKADTQGSLEAVRQAIEREGEGKVRANVLSGGVGGISESDVNLAAASHAVVIGFNVRADSRAEEIARQEDVPVHLHTIIYQLVEDILKLMEGLLKPVVREEVLGRCEVREVFSNTREGRIAGGYINFGKLDRSSLVRIYRDDVLVHSGILNSLRRFKEDVSSVGLGNECGFRITNYTDIRTGDLLEAYVRIEEQATLAREDRSRG